MQPIFARIMKVDEQTRTVTGRAAQEVVDRDNEIFDYNSSKPEFMKWSAEVSADTGGKSLGNIRSMHGNIAAGKVTDINFNDVEKAIDISAKIIDDNEWEKVLEGVHTGFSIGGRYARKWAEPINGKLVQRYTAIPSEISIVDRPCCPTAKFFEVHKRDGSTEQREFLAYKDFDDGVEIEIGENGEIVFKGGPGSGPSGGRVKMVKLELTSDGTLALVKGGPGSGPRQEHSAKKAEAATRTASKISRSKSATSQQKADAHAAASNAHREAMRDAINNDDGDAAEDHRTQIIAHDTASRAYDSQK